MKGCGAFAGIFFGFIAAATLSARIQNARWILLSNGCNNFSPRSKRNTTYGHIHMAKTGGTTLNGMLALNFERICGHKGYSYDFFQANERFNKHLDEWKDVHDLISKTNKGYNRGRVPTHIMDEIGYEDCDWISFEAGAKIWHRFDSWYQRMELHLPCREPIDYLMSQCNHRKRNFDCGASDLLKEIEKCVMEPTRFSIELTGASYPNLDVKCFDFELAFTLYIDHMKNILTTKGTAAEYHRRETNLKRNKTNECIWNSTEIKDSVTSHLINNYDYYAFCHTCIGSKNDLFSNIQTLMRKNQ